MLSGRIVADPDSVLPDCVSTHVNVSGPNPSDPLPVHVPVRFSEDVAGGGGEGGGVLTVGEGAVVDGELPPHASSSQLAASPAITTAPQRTTHFHVVTFR